MGKLLTVLCCSGVAFAREEAKAEIGIGCGIAASRGSMPAMSYGTGSTPPATPGMGASGTLRPAGYLYILALGII